MALVTAKILQRTITLTITTRAVICQPHYATTKMTNTILRCTLQPRVTTIACITKAISATTDITLLTITTTRIAMMNITPMSTTQPSVIQWPMGLAIATFQSKIPIIPTPMMNGTYNDSFSNKSNINTSEMRAYAITINDDDSCNNYDNDSDYDNNSMSTENNHIDHNNPSYR